jgi:serine/threonine protein kinase/tetratricopeptide (TPR) repeat protein
MSGGRWQTLDRLFTDALHVPGEARAARLARACGTDEQLQRDVLSLLAAAESSGDFLERPAFEQLGRAMAADGRSLRPGERLGTYTVRELLGAGGVGEVWRATDERLDRDVAIKLLLPHLSGDPQRTRRFAEEARTAGSLNHPNILSVYDIGEHGGVPFIVSEYVGGESLRTRLTRGPLPIDLAAAVALQIARGLSAAHARGIIHCDLKPDNLFIRSDGGVKILDFGLARLKTAPASSPEAPDVTVWSLAGTAGYIAPEQVLGEEADVRSDLFALGVTMFEMLAGTRPFRGGSVVETLNATLTFVPPDLRGVRPGVPASLSRTVMRLLERAPASRFSSADELIAALEQVTTAGTAHSPRRWPIVSAAAVVTIGIIGAALMSPTTPPAGPVALGPSGSTSIDAYRLYGRGLDASVNARWPEAVTWLEQAIGADPAFAEAHLRLALAYGALGQVAARDRALRRASAHAARLTERDRLLLAVSLEADPGGDPTRRAQLLDELLARFPDVEEAYPVAFGLYHPVQGVFPNLEKLLTVTRTGATVLPASPQTRKMYAFALTEAGRLGEAIPEFQEYARLAPREPNPFDSLGGVYLSLGAPVQAIQAYSRALEIDPGFPSGSGLAYALGMLGRYEEALAVKPSIVHVHAFLVSRTGRYAEAEGILRRGLERAQTDGDMFIAAGIHLTSAALSLERKDHAAVHREVAAIRGPLSRVSPGFARHWSLMADTLGGLADLGLGRSDRVQALADSQARTVRPSHPVERFWHQCLQGELALARGDAAGAAKAFSAGEIPGSRISLDIPGAVVTKNLSIRDGVARSAHARGDLPAAIAIYRRLLANGPDQKYTALYEPRYVLQLARLLEQSGNRPAARTEYRRFLDLWTHADANLPELAEARQALAVK